MPSPPSNAYRIALLVLMLSAFFLRVYKLDSQSLWYDEGVTAIVSQYDLASLSQWTADDIQPPLYYVVMAGWGRLAGWSEWSLRFLSVLFGLLTVPLLVALTVRWNRSRLAGALTAILAAFHPLLLYYSQEARMYALLLALGIAVAYCLLRIGYTEARGSDGERQRGRYPWGRRGSSLWIVYTLVAGAALYTHYFAAFCLLAVNIAYLLHFPRSSSGEPSASPSTQSVIRSTLLWLIANTAVILLYIPWLGTLFTRLNVDTSYWEGSLKLWEAVGSIAIRFTSGETVLEGPATRLLWMYSAVTLLALAGLVTGSRRTRMAQSVRFTLRYPLLLLFVPIVAVLALASFTPKFNARYVMVALPGLLLVWSAGLAELLRAFVPVWQRLQRVACNTQPRALPAIAGLVGTGLLLAGFIQADINWFVDDAFTKDQWRELAAYVQGEIEGNEAVVLVSGHAWPIWRYYAPQIEPVRLPESEILDVTAVVDMENSTEILRPGLLGKKGVWLVGWQDDVIDPTDVAGLQLARAGEEKPLDVQFWGIRLRRFVIVDARSISNRPPIQQPFQANFENTVELLGSSVERGGDLLLFWRLTDPPTPLPDLYLTAETRTEAGLIYARMDDRRLSAYDFPTFRWQIGQIVVGRIPAAEWTGTGAPAGNYQLHLGVYDPALDTAGLDLIGPDGAQLGKRVTLPIVLEHPVPLSADEDPTAWQPLVEGLFVHPDLASDTVEAGGTVALQLRWFSEHARTIGHVTVNWQERNRDVHREGAPIPIDVSLPANQSLRTVHQLSVPVDLPAGDYWLELSADSQLARSMVIPVTVLPSSRTFVMPTLAPVLSANFDDQIVLAGLTETELPKQALPGAVLPLTFVWQSRGLIHSDYTMSVQWLDENGRPAGQQDEELPRGSSLWLPNEVVSQIIELSTPKQPGAYRLIVAVYDANARGLPRLRLPSGEDFVQVADIQIQP